MNVNHLYTELNKIDSCMEKLYKKSEDVSWHEADEVDIQVIQDYMDIISAKLMNYRARVGMEYRKAMGETDHAA